MKDRKFNRRSFLQMAGLTTAGVALAACAPGAGSNAGGGLAAPPADIKATINIFNFGGEADKVIYDAAYVRFKKKYPNVEIVDTFVAVDTWGNFTQKFATAIAGGQALDILHIAIEGAAMVASKNIMRPLDDLVALPASTELINDIAPALTNSLKYKGKFHLIPDSWNNMCIHYNTKLFKEAGIAPPKEDWTWDDFLAAAQKLTKGEGNNKVWGFGIPAFNFGLQPWFLTATGSGTLTDDWTKSNLDNPGSLEAMQFLYDLVYKYKVSPTTEGTDNGQLFAAGKMAMTGFGHWPIQSYMANKFTDYDVQYWPRKKAATSVFGVGGWGIPTASKNPALAWEVIKELAALETMQATAQAGVAIPARRTVGEGKEFISNPPNAKIFYGCLKDAKPVPSPTNFAEVEQVFMRHFTEMMSKSVQPKDATAAAHKELADLMSKVTN
jgi:multiple sugar transport system substrate-binding protein